MMHDPFPWPTHAPDCACADCHARRDDAPSLIEDARDIGLWCAAGTAIGLAIVALHGWWTDGPGLAGMVGL